MAKRIRLVLPAGRCAFPHLDIPDGKFGEPKFKVSINYTAEEMAPIKKMLVDAAKELMGPKFNAKKLPKMPVRASKDRDGKEDGSWLIAAQSGKDYRPALFDAKLNKLEKAPGPGSVIKLDVSPTYYESFGGGISLRLYGVQVLELAEGGKSMFEATDGYEATAASGFSADAEDDAGEDSEDAVAF